MGSNNFLFGCQNFFQLSKNFYHGVEKLFLVAQQTLLKGQQTFLGKIFFRGKIFLVIMVMIIASRALLGHDFFEKLEYNI